MKTIVNRKEWLDGMWYYTAHRLANGKQYTSKLVIDKYTMHNRQVVAWKVRDWREDMRRYIAKEKLLAFT